MERRNLILYGELGTPRPTGVLDTPARVREASEELLDAVLAPFQEFDRMKMQTWIDAHYIALD